MLRHRHDRRAADAHDASRELAKRRRDRGQHGGNATARNPSEHDLGSLPEPQRTPLPPSEPASDLAPIAMRRKLVPAQIAELLGSQPQMKIPAAELFGRVRVVHACWV